MSNDLENRLQVLEDVEAIKNLKARYCILVDAATAGDHSKIDELTDLFVEDAWVDFSAFGRHTGKNSICAFYKEVVLQTLSYSSHMVTNPLITVTGRKAVGRWYVFVPCTLKISRKAAWLHGRYIEDYEKMEGRWFWQSITAKFDFITPYEDGWVKTPMPVL